MSQSWLAGASRQAFVTRHIAHAEEHVAAAGLSLHEVLVVLVERGWIVDRGSVFSVRRREALALL